MPTVDCPPERKRTHRAAILTELRELQSLVMDNVRNAETSPAVRAQLMRAYVELQKQRNVERMRPAPKPIEVIPKGQSARVAYRKPRLSRGPTIELALISPSAEVEVAAAEPAVATSTPGAHGAQQQ